MFCHQILRAGLIKKEGMYVEGNTGSLQHKDEYCRMFLAVLWIRMYPEHFVKKDPDPE
jgi:hypothetical protein